MEILQVQERDRYTCRVSITNFKFWFLLRKYFVEKKDLFYIQSLVPKTRFILRHGHKTDPPKRGWLQDRVAPAHEYILRGQNKNRIKNKQAFELFHFPCSP